MESKKEPNLVGRKPIKYRTWIDGEINCFDDCQLFQKDDVKKLESEFPDRESYCKLLRKEGEYFYFCGIGVGEYPKLPRPDNPAFRNRVTGIKLKKCMSNCNECESLYTGEFVR